MLQLRCWNTHGFSFQIAVHFLHVCVRVSVYWMPMDVIAEARMGEEQHWNLLRKWKQSHIWDIQIVFCMWNTVLLTLLMEQRSTNWWILFFTKRSWKVKKITCSDARNHSCDVTFSNFNFNFKRHRVYRCDGGVPARVQYRATVWMPDHSAVSCCTEAWMPAENAPLSTQVRSKHSWRIPEPEHRRATC